MREWVGSGLRAEQRRDQAFTLIEVLVGAAVAAVVLAGAYGWLWNVAALAGETDDRVQAGTLAAAAARAVGDDVRAAVEVRQPPAGRDPASSISLAHDHVDVAPEEVLVVWDPARAVVWRNASGTYIADHITGFTVVYRLTDGRWLGGAEMAAPDWPNVRRLRVELAATVGSATVSRALEMNVGPA
ncbi:MAG: prepilin-type N-terminal cleavage/methylation domain-containing protein [Deltaproteobacteria bacterium]